MSVRHLQIGIGFDKLGKNLWIDLAGRIQILEIEAVTEEPTAGFEHGTLAGTVTQQQGSINIEQKESGCFYHSGRWQPFQGARLSRYDESERRLERPEPTLSLGTGTQVFLRRRTEPRNGSSHLAHSAVSYRFEPPTSRAALQISGPVFCAPTPPGWYSLLRSCHRAR